MMLFEDAWLLSAKIPSILRFVGARCTCPRAHAVCPYNMNPSIAGIGQPIPSFMKRGAIRKHIVDGRTNL
jgi:hypothetical protein